MLTASVLLSLVTFEYIKIMSYIETNFVKHITNYDCAKFRNSLQTNFAFPHVITVCSRLLLHSLQIDRVNPKCKSSFCCPLSCPGPVFDLLLMMDRCPSFQPLRWRIISGLLAITSALVLLHLDTATGNGETGFLYLWHGVNEFLLGDKLKWNLWLIEKSDFINSLVIIRRVQVKVDWWTDGVVDMLWIKWKRFFLWLSNYI